MTDVVVIAPENVYTVTAIGIQGPPGAVGPAGESITGPAGPTGPQGAQGIPGPNSIFGYDVGLVISAIPEFSVLVFNGENWSPMLASELTDGGTF